MTEAKTEPDLKPFVQAILGRKAMDLVALDVARVTDVADVFMICSGRSSRQVSAIAEYVESELKKAGIRPLSVEGVKDGQWALIDYGYVIVHIFYDPVRRFYDLESLWADARRIDLSAYPQFQQTAEESDDSDE
ncbi:ribosome-associated protein [Desulfosalsimonas propionicica]|uniref:Ribosomal silencing factor RsfS n=1 Tax=Desulfosalsimonas propionicica TaxID=332175 RepID=A0A7W0C6G4_9BACT|nr:ribosome silencing factor [Desulfosalsimonas propionicica]MBA2879983.1 ribosome-associated protein [Desulfosalsimonas propionicica]